MNPNKTGTKAAAHYQLNVGAGKTRSSVCGLAMRRYAGRSLQQGFDQIMETRRREADEFYRAITPAGVSEDEALVMRQALAGMLWSKQYFFFDVDIWLENTASIR